MRWPPKSFLPACGVDPSLQPFVTYDELAAAVSGYCADSDPAFEGTYGALSKDGDIRVWNVRSVTVFASRRFVQPGAGCDADISRWHTAQVTNLNSMFANNKRFNSDISGWDVSNVNTMEGTFNGATALLLLFSNL
jgi:surface protein